MTSELSNREPQDAAVAGAASDEPVVNLQIVSPSVGVTRALMFPGLPATTTIKQLKDKIRDTLPLKPAGENQRLIYRGRAILRETDTLLDIFGADTFRSPDQQTMHLVIRDTTDSQSSTPPAGSASTQSPAPNAPRQNIHSSFFGPPPPGMTRRTPLQPTSHPLPQPRIPSPARAQSPAPHHTPEQAAAFQHQHQSMTHWLTQLQREAMSRTIVNQNQRGRAQMGMRGVGDNAGNQSGHASETNSGRASPVQAHQTTQTIYRELIGPNGNTYRIETTTGGLNPLTIPVSSVAQSPMPQGVPSPAEVQNMIRGADLGQAGPGMPIHRSASGTSLYARNFTLPLVPTPMFAAAGGSRASSGRATPDPGAGPASAGGVNVAAAWATQAPQQRQGHEVYILSSPEGPRALLVNHSTSETYYTPRLRMQRSQPQLRSAASYSNLIYAPQPLSRDDINQQQLYMEQRHGQHQQVPVNQPQQPQQQHHQQQQHQQGHEQQQAGGIPFHPHNNPAAALPPLLVQALPHVWLIIRLALFVWFFTSPSSTWSRWFMVIALAFFMFVLSIGSLNGLADHAWRPLGRHLQNIFPTLDGVHVGQEQQEGVGADGQNGNPDPARMAARLVQDRGSWLANQIRSLERAGLLFLASIAPGVAERHIANLEAEARAAESRRREAEAAAATAAAAAAEAEATAAEVSEPSGEKETTGEGNETGHESKRAEAGFEAPEAQ